MILFTYRTYVLVYGPQENRKSMKYRQETTIKTLKIIPFIVFASYE